MEIEEEFNLLRKKGIGENAAAILVLAAAVDRMANQAPRQSQIQIQCNGATCADAVADNMPRASESRLDTSEGKGSG